MSHPPVLVVCTAASAASLTHPLQANHHDVQVVDTIAAWFDDRCPAAPLCVVIEVDDGANALLDLELWKRLRRGGAAVVCIYGGNDLRFAVRAIREGAVDVLPKPVDAAALVAAVAEALAKAATSHDDAKRGAKARELLDRCTPRERAIIVRAVSGLRNKLIAAELACKESTVKVHRSRAMRKLGLRSLAELMQVVESAGERGTFEACTPVRATASTPRAQLRTGSDPPTLRLWA